MSSCKIFSRKVFSSVDCKYFCKFSINMFKIFNQLIVDSTSINHYTHHHQAAKFNKKTQQRTQLKKPVKPNMSRFHSRSPKFKQQEKILIVACLLTCNFLFLSKHAIIVFFFFLFIYVITKKLLIKMLLTPSNRPQPVNSCFILFISLVFYHLNVLPSYNSINYFHSLLKIRRKRTCRVVIF